MEDIHAIRTHLALNEEMRRELHEALERLFRSFGLQVDPRLLDAATLTTEEELLSRPPPTPAPPAAPAPALTAAAWPYAGWGWAYAAPWTWWRRY